MVDAVDLKSIDSNVVGVQVPPRVPFSDKQAASLMFTGLSH